MLPSCHNHGFHKSETGHKEGIQEINPSIKQKDVEERATRTTAHNFSNASTGKAHPMHNEKPPFLKDQKIANTLHACKTCLCFFAFVHLLVGDIEENYNQVLTCVILFVVHSNQLSINSIFSVIVRLDFMLLCSISAPK